MALLQRAINMIQRISRRLDTSYLESIYQNSYFFLVDKSEWVDRDNLSIASPNGGTSSFSFLYILIRIYREKKIKSILELGVGESTKLSQQYVKAFDRNLTAIDDNDEWLKRCIIDSPQVKSIYAPLAPCIINHKNTMVYWYQTEQPSEKYDLIIIDGPMAYDKLRSKNRLGILNWIPNILDDEFVIVLDDVNRNGEFQLMQLILESLKKEGINYHSRIINGANSQAIICSDIHKGLSFL